MNASTWLKRSASRGHGWVLLVFGVFLAATPLGATELVGRITVNASGTELLPGGVTSLPLKRVRIHLGTLEYVGDDGERFYMLFDSAETDEDGNYTIDLPDPAPGQPISTVAHGLVVVLAGTDGAVEVRDSDNDGENPACLGTQEIPVSTHGTTRADVELKVLQDNDSAYETQAQAFRPTEDKLALPVFGREPRCREETLGNKLLVSASGYDARGLTNSKPERFAHLAVHYARAYDAYEFVRDGLGKGSFPGVRVDAWDIDESMAYSCSRKRIRLDAPNSLVLGPEEKSAVFDMRHEYGHHFMCVSPIALADDMPPLAAGDERHSGLLNSNSADAWTEGFATWFAAAAAAYKGESRPHVQITAAGELNLRYGAEIDNPFAPGQQFTFGLLGEEFAVASLLWDVSEVAGSRLLIDALEKATTTDGSRPFLDLVNFSEVYIALKVDDSVGAFFDSLPCDFIDTATSSYDVDCLFIDRGFYHDKNGDGLFGPLDVAGTNEEVGRTRWPLGLWGESAYRPHVPVLPGSVLRLSVSDRGVPVAVNGFQIRTEYDAPLADESSEYTQAVSGDGPYEIGILLPGVPSRAIITPVLAGKGTVEPLVVESDFFHERVNPFRPGGIEPILAEHTFSVMPEGNVFEAGELKLVGQKRIGRTTFDYTYRVEVINTGLAVPTLTAQVTSTDPHTVVVDGSLAFSSVPANGTAFSVDTFTLRHDRRFPFEPAALSFNFEISP